MVIYSIAVKKATVSKICLNSFICLCKLNVFSPVEQKETVQDVTLNIIPAYTFLSSLPDKQQSEPQRQGVYSRYSETCHVTLPGSSLQLCLHCDIINKMSAVFSSCHSTFSLTCCQSSALARVQVQSTDTVSYCNPPPVCLSVCLCV